MDKDSAWLYSLDPILLTIIVMSSLGVLLGAVCAGLLLYCTCSYGGLTSRSTTTLENYNFELYDGIKHKVKLNQQRICSEAWGRQIPSIPTRPQKTQFDSSWKEKQASSLSILGMHVHLGWASSGAFPTLQLSPRTSSFTGFLKTWNVWCHKDWNAFQGSASK